MGGGACHMGEYRAPPGDMLLRTDCYRPGSWMAYKLKLSMLVKMQYIPALVSGGYYLSNASPPVVLTRTRCRWTRARERSITAGCSTTVPSLRTESACVPNEGACKSERYVIIMPQSGAASEQLADRRGGDMQAGGYSDRRMIRRSDVQAGGYRQEVLVLQIA